MKPFAHIKYLVNTIKKLSEKGLSAKQKLLLSYKDKVHEIVTESHR